MHIDWWTLALQTINVLVLVWLLGHFFYRPVAELVERRRAAAAKLLSDAQTVRAAADAERAEIVATRDGFAAERERLLAEARHQAEAERESLLKGAVEAVAKLHSEGEAALSRERAAMQEALVQRASVLAAEIACRLLQRVPPEVATSFFIDGLGRQTEEMPPKSRALLVGATSAEIVTATPPSEFLQEHCHAALKPVLPNAKLAFRQDPALIAGIEIRGDSFILRNNWRDDLAEILKQVETDDGQRQVP